jgi:hypothetical protein
MITVKKSIFFCQIHQCDNDFTAESPNVSLGSFKFLRNTHARPKSIWVRLLPTVSHAMECKVDEQSASRYSLP